MGAVLFVGCQEGFSQGLPVHAKALRIGNLLEAPKEHPDVVVVGSQSGSPTVTAQRLAKRYQGTPMVIAVPSEAYTATADLLRVTPFVPIGVQLTEDTPSAVQHAVSCALLRSGLRRAQARASIQAGKVLVGASGPAEESQSIQRELATDTDALSTFFRFYERHRSDISKVLRSHAAEMPGLAELMASQSPEALDLHETTSAKLETAAILGGDWEPYLAHLRDQGTLCAQLGIPFGTWYELLKPLRQLVMDRLLHECAPTSPAFSTTILGMGRFIDIAMATIGEGYARSHLVRANEFAARERLFASVVQSSEDAIFSTALDGSVTSWNRGAEVLFHVKEERAVGAPVGTLLSSALVDALHDVQAKRHHRSFETTLTPAGGTPIDVSLTISPIESDSDGIVGASWIVHNIGRRLRAVRALEERTNELKRSNEDLEQFAYIASHDLQEPLRMVTAYMDLVSKRYSEVLDERGQLFIHYAVDGATRMKQLINDLLDYSRIETRGSSFAWGSANDALHATLGSSRLLLEQTGTQVRAGDLPRVFADHSQLRQVMANLLSNAVKFRSNEAPKIEVTARRDGAHWEFRFEDNGIGLEPEHKERIFQMFQRLHEAAKYPGTGIGLAVTRRIIARHEGRIWVTSEQGRGSIFHFTLPALEEPTVTSGDDAST